MEIIDNDKDHNDGDENDGDEIMWLRKMDMEMMHVTYALK